MARSNKTTSRLVWRVRTLCFSKRARWLQETLIGEMQIIGPRLGAGHNRDGPLPRTSKVQWSTALINHNHRLHRIPRGTRSKTTGGKQQGSEWWSVLKKVNSVMDGQGLQALKPPPSVIHCHPAVISGSLIHFPSSETLLKASLLLPFGFWMVQNKHRGRVTSSMCRFKRGNHLAGFWGWRWKC